VNFILWTVAIVVFLILYACAISWVIGLTSGPREGQKPGGGSPPVVRGRLEPCSDPVNDGNAVRLYTVDEGYLFDVITVAGRVALLGEELAADSLLPDRISEELHQRESIEVAKGLMDLAIKAKATIAYDQDPSVRDRHLSRGRMQWERMQAGSQGVSVQA
jgi:hypothetical protein